MLEPVDPGCNGWKNVIWILDIEEPLFTFFCSLLFLILEYFHIFIPCFSKYFFILVYVSVRFLLKIVW